MSRNQIRVPLDWICKHHRARLPLGLHGTAGAVVLQVVMFQAISSEERILRRQGWKPEAEGGNQADGKDLELLIAEVAPWCCFLKPEEYRLCLEWAIEQRRTRKPVDHQAWFARLEEHRRAA